MAHNGFHMGAQHGGGSVDPNELNMNGGYGNSFQNNYNSNQSSGANGFSSGNALFGDDELLEGLGSPTEAPSGLPGQEFGSMHEMNLSYQQQQQGVYNGHQGLPMDQPHINGYSNTPEGDPIQSPYVHNFGQYQQMRHPQAFGGSLQSPVSYGGSPMANDMGNDSNDPNYLNAKARARMSQAMQRKASSSRSPLTPKAAAAGPAVPMNAQDPAFPSQPIRTNGAAHHEKSVSGQWIQTPNSLSSFPGSGFSSPLQAGMHSAQINDFLLKGGTSMPAKLGAQGGGASTQDLKKKRRRESHNLVERRRRDNINERIQDLSKLVPMHRLEDEKIRKAIQNGTPLSPTLNGISTPGQATSGLAGPGARRATSGTAGNITTGLPIEDKDKGPNKGDILNGAVSWTRDLMWMLHLKIQQQEELMNYITELGGQIPFELTDDERRMQTELLETMTKNEDADGGKSPFSYTRTHGSGLRVPHHTDYKGEPIDGISRPIEHHISVSPDAGHSGLGADVDSGEFLDYDDEELNFKEEDEYGMDLTS